MQRLWTIAFRQTTWNTCPSTSCQVANSPGSNLNLYEGLIHKKLPKILRVKNRRRMMGLWILQTLRETQHRRKMLRVLESQLRSCNSCVGLTLKTLCLGWLSMNNWECCAILSSKTSSIARKILERCELKRLKSKLWTKRWTTTMIRQRSQLKKWAS